MTDPVTGAMASGAALNAISKIVEGMNTPGTMFSGKKTITAVASAARVEPLTIVDSSVLHLDYLPDVLQSLQSIFSGYYLQAWSLLADVGNINVIEYLDRLNPNRKVDASNFISHVASVAGAAMEDNSGLPSWKLAHSSYEWRLPTSGNKAAMESEMNDKVRRDSAGLGEQKSIASIHELANLSVGKMLNVTLTSNGQTATIPVSIRLIVNEMSASNIATLLSSGGDENSFTERYYKWRAGRIEFIRDLLLCQDMLKDKKKLMMQDRSGILQEIERRNKNAKLAHFVTKNPSLGAATNLFVVSADTVKEIKRKSGNDIENARQREQLFEEINGMIMVVIDPMNERIRFYHRDIDMPTSVGVRDIKISNKSSGPDIGDILNAYKRGEAPSL